MSIEYGLMFLTHVRKEGRQNPIGYFANQERDAGLISSISAVSSCNAFSADAVHVAGNGVKIRESPGFAHIERTRRLLQTSLRSRLPHYRQ